MPEEHCSEEETTEPTPEECDLGMISLSPGLFTFLLTKDMNPLLVLSALVNVPGYEKINCSSNDRH